MKEKIDVKNKCNKDDIYKNLENINSWINNSDTKASIVLGLNGVILSIIFTNDIFINKYTNIFKKVFKNINFSDILYIGFTISSIAMLVFGLYKLIKVLVPTLKATLNNSKPSHNYFGGIASFNSCLEFKTSLNSLSEEDVIDELLSQVYINSIICNNKFKNFRGGLKYSLIGFILIIILFTLGLLVY